MTHSRLIWEIKCEFQRTLGALSEGTICPLAVGDIVLVGLNTGEESFERGSTGAVLAIDSLSGLRRHRGGLRSISKQRIGNVVTSDATSSLKRGGKDESERDSSTFRASTE